jgi:hypothetical protein
MKGASTFWSWFSENERRFRDIEVPEKEQLLDELQENLQAVCEHFWFEVGGGETGPRELVITAEGRVSVFAQLLEFVRAAPIIAGWEVVAFKPPQGFAFVTEYEDIILAPEATWFLPLFSASKPQSLGLRVAFAHFETAKERQFMSAAYLMLEAGLGELAAAQEIDYLEVCRAPSVPESEGFRNLRTLPDYLAERSGGLVSNKSLERTREG